MRLGIDVGGTFTDLALSDDETGKIYAAKTLTTPGDLAQGVLGGIDKVLALAGVGIEDVAYIAHGTTIGTNALIERKGAKVGLITTEGFRDVLEIARIERPDAGLYDMTIDLPAPLVPRYLRLEVSERVGADGSVVRPLDPQSVVRAAERFKAAGVESIAVCLLFSFRNPAHEQTVREICQELYPGVPVSLSCEVAPEFREFERTSTVVMNAYLTPVTERYLDTLICRLDERYGRLDVRIMQASGGAMTAESARSRAVQMVNSGPAGGALAAALFGRLAGLDKVISVDMGGTSFDIGLVVNGRPRVKPEGEFEGFPVKIPLTDVEGIGAGGGSIAWVDAGGALNIGPQSAGASPGPACYGQGGERPTVTDANLVLGRLNPDYFLGGEMPLQLDRACRAIEQFVARPLGLSIEEAAAGIIRVVNANMCRGISANTTQKGYDVREFALLAFGGAGPLHAVELAQEMGIGRVIVPPYCAVFSALGAMASDVRHDYVQTVALSQAAATPARLQGAFGALEAQARQQLSRENVGEEQMIIQWAADLRYEGQSYELTVPLACHKPLSDEDVSRLIADFHDLHRRIYAYGDVAEAVEMVNARVTAIGKVPELNLIRSGDPGLAVRPKAERVVYFAAGGFLQTDIYERAALAAGQPITGPCLVEEPTSTTVIPPGARVTVDGFGNLTVVIN
jgi:N-methylhydantoinase A